MNDKEFYDLMENLGDKIRDMSELGMFQPIEDDELVVEKILLPKRPYGLGVPSSYNESILKHQRKYLEIDKKTLFEIKEQIIKYKEGKIVISMETLLGMENIMQSYVDTSIKIIKELENRK